MRLELAALKALGRIEKFGPTVDWAEAWAAFTYGAESPIHRRYVSLKLKFLEESGDREGLLVALDELIAQPREEPDRTAILSSALRYEARVLLELDRRDEAVAALERAKEAMVGRTGWETRLKEIDEELTELRRTADPVVP
jgi:hypothetical protein